MLGPPTKITLLHICRIKPIIKDLLSSGVLLKDVSYVYTALIVITNQSNSILSQGRSHLS